MLLYQKHGDSSALRQISLRIDGIKVLIEAAGGEFVHSRGDDVLATFPDTMSALNVIIEVLRPQPVPMIQLRVGAHFGGVIRDRNDIFGDAVNLTARFAAKANPGEAIISQEFVDRLSSVGQCLVRYFDELSFRGKSNPQRIYTLASADLTLQTEIVPARLPPGRRSERATQVELYHGDMKTVIGVDQSISFGRSADCGIVIDRKWVSRHHGTITLADGRVSLVERSSSGTFISMQNGPQVFTRRESVLLIGSGKLSPGLSIPSPEAELIHFHIIY